MKMKFIAFNVTLVLRTAFLQDLKTVRFRVPNTQGTKSTETATEISSNEKFF